MFEPDARSQLAHVALLARSEDVRRGHGREEKRRDERRRGEHRKAARDDPRAHSQRAQHDERDHQRAIEKVVVRAEALQQHDAGRAPGASRLAGLQVEDQLGQGEGHEAMRHDVEPGPLVHLIRVERVERARGPGRHRRQPQYHGQPSAAHGREEADQTQGHVRGQDGVPRRPLHGRDGERGEQPMVGEGQRTDVRVQDVGVEEVRGRAEELLHVPGDDVHALQRIADIGDGVARPQRLGQEAEEDEHGVERDGDDGFARAPRRHGREHYGRGGRASMSAVSRASSRRSSPAAGGSEAGDVDDTGLVRSFHRPQCSLATSQNNRESRTAIQLVPEPVGYSELLIARACGPASAGLRDINNP